jgi:hypothetical protein
MNPTTPSRASGLSANQPRLRVVRRADVCREWPLAIARRQLLAQCNSGNGNLRPETLGAPRRERSPERAKPTAEIGSPRTGYGNVGLFLTLGSHVGLCGLPGGAEGIRTSDLRSQPPAASRFSLYGFMRRSDKEKWRGRASRLSRTVGWRRLQPSGERNRSFNAGLANASNRPFAALPGWYPVGKECAHERSVPSKTGRLGLGFKLTSRPQEGAP